MPAPSAGHKAQLAHFRDELGLVPRDNDWEEIRRGCKELADTAIQRTGLSSPLTAQQVAAHALEACKSGSEIFARICMRVPHNIKCPERVILRLTEYYIVYELAQFAAASTPRSITNYADSEPGQGEESPNSETGHSTNLSTRRRSNNMFDPVVVDSPLLLQTSINPRNLLSHDPAVGSQTHLTSTEHQSSNDLMLLVGFRSANQQTDFFIHARLEESWQAFKSRLSQKDAMREIHSYAVKAITPTGFSAGGSREVLIADDITFKLLLRGLLKSEDFAINLFIEPRRAGALVRNESSE